MDISEYTGIILGKLQKFEPENASKILGYLLVQEHGEEEMAKLASLPDHLIGEVAFQTRTKLPRSAARSIIPPISPPMNCQPGFSQFSVISPTSVITADTPTTAPSFQLQSPFWDPQSVNNANAEYMAQGYLDSISELQKQTPFFTLENHMDAVNSRAVGTSGTPSISNDYYGLDALSVGNLGGKAGRRFDHPVKTCHYFNKGFCKHGNSCRYYHGLGPPDAFPHMYGNDSFNDDQMISPGSLAQLESEIVELLKLKKGGSISIASLPMAYFEKYKKVLQADGYLTESQRHGKSGYSLTKLLARLKNSIRLIDRPHGQHSVVLAEDAPKFNGKGDYGRYISASRQIYLTFPADSTFSEADVSNYFSTFGKVEDVRIPSQERRMFGFVTFDDPETVKAILDKGNPHYVCESRVLVKPYKEKPKLMLRKQSDRIEHQHHAYYSAHYVDVDTEPTPSENMIYSSLEPRFHVSVQSDIFPRGCSNPRLLRSLIIEQQEEAAFEFHRRRFAELQLAQKSFTTSPHLGFNTGVAKASNDLFNVHSAESQNHVVNDKSGYMDNNYTAEDSNQGLNLPDSPFSFPVDSGISAVI
ncbi:zinc finger CCCH domain-containing protein 18 isoform X2 [Vigna angularis]|uniref:zinc finger CCCH domain-containing protein 18 isoform X2 n=1 Tax=Phaseolus angularis TaxID=3914 RepID=UPI00080A276A|nr:zinc finger CCCH domain-containing protein 18 isoform X2 [Vigna angularis]XP_017434383.1 zinc finger CCCH domain-containing protein 18 isoform X2 [Vigna angularis]